MRLIQIIRKNKKDWAAKMSRLLDRGLKVDAELMNQVAAIVDDVRRRGDRALTEYTARFDGVLLQSSELRVNEETLRRSAERVDLSFSDEAVREIARDAERVNRALENIGARRLHTILERLLEEISFAGPENAGRAISIGVDDVRGALSDLVRDEDLSRYVL